MPGLIALCLAALGIALSVVPAAAHGPVAPAASNGPGPAGAHPLTRLVVDLALRLRQADHAARPALLSDLIAAARARRARLEALVDEHPEEVLRSALSEPERALLPAEAQAYIEDEETAEGIVDVFHADAEDGGRYLHALRTAGGRLALRLAGRLPDLLTGDRVRVRGVRVGATLAAGGATGVTVLAAAEASALGAQPTLAIVVNFTNTPGTYTSAVVSQVQATLFGPSGATVTNYFREASYQRTWLTGQAVGPYPIAMSTAGCDYPTLGNLARAAASNAGINLTPYTRFMYLFPANGCSWAGLSTIGGNPAQAWMNGYLQAGLMAHEIGHGFGLYHSHSLECGSAVMGGACSAIDYGDTLDVMGSGAAPLHLNAPQKERLGWLNASGAPPIATVQQSGVYTLAPYESTGTAPKGIKIQRPNGDWFYVEYRQPIGFDASIPLSVRTGVVVHLWEALDPDGIYLLDMTPATASWADPALGVNQTFNDPGSGITITPLWATATDAGVSVSMSGGPPPCTRVNPLVSVSPGSAHGAPGSRLTYTVSLTNRDSAGCPASTFSLVATAGGGFSVALLVDLLTVSPGATSTTALDVTSPVTAPPATVGIGVVAAGVTAPLRTVSANATYTVGGAATGTVVDAFDRPDADTLDNGWSPVAGEFSIEGGAAWSAPAAGVSKAVLPALSGAEQIASAEFARMRSGGPRFGVLLRYRDGGDYYACYRQTGGQSKLRIVRAVGGVEVTLAEASIRNPRIGQPFVLTCRAEGATLTLSVDGTTVSATDGTFASGSVGMMMGHPPTTGTPRAHRATLFSASVE